MSTSVSVDFPAVSRDDTAGTVAIATMGCKVNTYESELIRKGVVGRQWRVVDFSDSADLYVINTCTVTREADRQARQLVRRAVKNNPRARVVVTGCYAQIDPQACAEIPGVDLVLGNDQKLNIDAILSPPVADGQTVMVGDLDQQVTIPEQILSGYEGHTRAFVQIQQGCDQGCTFCIIHVARGPSRSFAPTLVQRQVQKLVGNGFREIVICGVDLGAYGEDFSGNGFGLAELLRELAAIDGDFRIRVSSIDPAHISDELIDLYRAEPKLCRHIHLSLQSGDSMILKRMKRRYDADYVRERIQRFRRACPDLVLGADIMAGFPTESEQAFDESLRMVDELSIAWPHVFVYSERDRTPAASIPASKQVPVAQRKARAKRLREAGDRVRAKLLAQKLGQSERVLVESGEAGRMQARAADYTPSRLVGVDASAGDWLDVSYRSLDGDGLIAESARND